MTESGSRKINSRKYGVSVTKAKLCSKNPLSMGIRRPIPIPSNAADARDNVIGISRYKG
jgi:hypothetical protein